MIPTKDETRESAIRDMYSGVSVDIRENLFDAILWARLILGRKEGGGHIFQLTAAGSDTDLLACEFSKPEWAGSHVGRGMELGSEAVIMAVCEYLNGG